MKVFISLVFAVALVFSACATDQKQEEGYDYGEVLHLSLLFYEAQRCGKLPADNRIPWRGDSFLDDGSDVGIDLTGGYFDAGDHAKFGFPAAFTTAVMGWGLLDYKDGYVAAGEYENGITALKWSLDYMIKTHTAPNVLWGQVGDSGVHHSFWGRPEEFPTTLIRPSLQINESAPGTDLAAEYAAAFAAGSMVFRDINDTYANNCLSHATELYNFANNFRGKYTESMGTDTYSSYKIEDELLWAAAWMYRATQNTKYLVDAKSFWDEYDLSFADGFNWDNKLGGAQVLLATMDVDPEYYNAASNFCNYIRNNVTRTPKGLIWLGEWGSLRSIATVSFACLQAAEAGINPIENRAMAKEQMDYILGSSGRSYVIGYGHNPPQSPHHRASSCPDPPAPCIFDHSTDPNPQVLYGGLVGGPDVNDYYVDDRADYVHNEVALDYNVGFQSVLAALKAFEVRDAASSVNVNYKPCFLVMVGLCALVLRTNL